MEQAAQREVLGHDERERAGCDPERDGDFQRAAAVVLRDRGGRNREVPQRSRDGGKRQSRDEETDADDGDGGCQSAPHGPTPATHLGA